MKSKSVLFVGCGDLGARAGQLLLAQGWQVAGARRDSSRLPAGFSGFDADYAVDGSLEFIARMQPDYVVTTFNPTERSVAGYEAGFHLATANLLAALDAHHPRHIIAVSSTRVFAERDGGWVDESSPLSEEDPRAVAMIRAEQLLLNSGHNASVVRFAGIYGTPGGRLLSRIKTGQLCPAQPPRYGNRIHRDDCARFLTHLLQRADAGAMVQPVYIGVDDRPAPQFEVESWLAEQMGVEVRPAEVRPAEAQPRAVAPAGHKRCRNRALHSSGYQLLYPDYKSGYAATLAEA